MSDPQSTDPTGSGEFQAGSPPPPPPPPPPVSGTMPPPPVSGTMPPPPPAYTAPPPPPEVPAPSPAVPYPQQQMPPMAAPQGGPLAPMGGQPSPLAAGVDYTGSFAAPEIEEAKVMSVIGYLGILFLVPMLAMPNNRFARFHANQGLVLFIFNIAVVFANFVLGFVPVIRWFSWILLFVPLVFIIMGIINAAGGRAKTLPFIGNFQLLK